MDKRLLDKVEIKSPTVKKFFKENLISLRQSCFEGRTGAWDSSSEEGREAFEPMIEALEEMAAYMGFKLPDLSIPDDDDEE